MRCRRCVCVCVHWVWWLSCNLPRKVSSSSTVVHLISMFDNQQHHGCTSTTRSPERLTEQIEIDKILPFACCQSIDVRCYGERLLCRLVMMNGSGDTEKHTRTSHTAHVCWPLVLARHHSTSKCVRVSLREDVCVCVFVMQMKLTRY